MFNKQNKQDWIDGPYQILVEVGDTHLRGDLDNILKQLTDYCVSRLIVPGDEKRFLREITMRFATRIPHACRVTLRPLAKSS